MNMSPPRPPRCASLVKAEVARVVVAATTVSVVGVVASSPLVMPVTIDASSSSSDAGLAPSTAHTPW